MKPIRSLLARWFAALAVALLAMPAFADPPARVGRLAEIVGQVWVYDEIDGEWILAVRNRPVTSGDRLSTESDARAEVQVGSVTWRLDSNSELEVLRLDDAAVQIQLHSGSVAVRARNREAARELEVLTAEGRFTPQRAGHFRVDRDDDVSTATVWSGAVNFRSEDSELDVEPGQRLEFWRDGERTHYSRHEPARDEFADWVLAEDARASERSASSRYVSPEMPGAEDLDRYGRWERSDDYGSLWVPYSVAPGWAPYRYGHWSYVGPWGWSWIDDAPWGFAPFHYGRWVHARGRWCWAPGAYVARPVYAPALVAWVGGPHASVSVNIGGRRPPAVGWFPLGPREIYVPTYRVSPVYIRNVNGGHVTHIDPAIIRQPTMAAQQQRYVNRFAPGAVTAVAPDVINRRQPVGRNIDPRMVREIEREPVSVALPVAALTARRDTVLPGMRQRMVPPPPNRLSAEPRVTRQRGERPSTAQAVPQIVPGHQGPAAAQQVAPAAPSVVTPPAARIVQPRVAEPRTIEPRVVEPRVVQPRAIERPTAPASPAVRHVQPPPEPAVMPRPPVAAAPVAPRPVAPPSERPVAPRVVERPVAPPAVVERPMPPAAMARPVAPAVQAPQAAPQVAAPAAPAQRVLPNPRDAGERQQPSRHNNMRQLER